MEATPFYEQYRVTLSGAGKIRNRAEAHLVGYAQQLLAKPVALTLEQVRDALWREQTLYLQTYPAHGQCSLSEISTASRIMGKPHLVTRGFGIYGRGRGIYTLSIAETVRKDASQGYAPTEAGAPAPTTEGAQP